jgi:hypothetical protein
LSFSEVSFHFLPNFTFLDQGEKLPLTIFFALQQQLWAELLRKDSWILARIKMAALLV